MASHLHCCIETVALSRGLPFSRLSGENPWHRSFFLNAHVLPSWTPLLHSARMFSAGGMGGTKYRAAVGGKAQRPAKSQEAKEGVGLATKGTQQAKVASESTPHEYHHDVALTIPAPLLQVWELWTDLENAPQWMPWITAVELSSDDGAPAPHEAADLKGGAALHARPLSKWICSTSGFQNESNLCGQDEPKIAWTARVTGVTEDLDGPSPQCSLEWATTEGLQSTGRVTFTQAEPADDGPESTCLELKIVHTLPPALARVMDGSALGGLIRATLRSDLERFQQYVTKKSKEAAGQSSKREPGEHPQGDHG